MVFIQDVFHLIFKRWRHYSLNVKLRCLVLWGWSKSTEVGGNKNQILRHLQKRDHQGVDKHNVYFPIPSIDNPHLSKFTYDFINIEIVGKTSFHNFMSNAKKMHQYHRVCSLPKERIQTLPWKFLSQATTTNIHFYCPWHNCQIGHA